MNKVTRVLECTFTLRTECLRTVKFLDLSTLRTSKLCSEIKQMIKCLSSANYFVYGNVRRTDADSREELLSKMCHIYTYVESINDIRDRVNVLAGKYPTWRGIDFRQDFSSLVKLLCHLEAGITLVTDAINELYDDKELQSELF